MKNLSAYIHVKWAIVRPLNGGIITKKDKKTLGVKDAMGKDYVAIWFPAPFENAVVDNLKRMKLSKEMLVTIITDAQFGAKQMPRTIPGTPFFATRKQLKATFTIGGFHFFDRTQWDEVVYG